MKTKTLIIAPFLFLLLFSGCKPEEECYTQGTSVNIGSTVGGGYSIDAYVGDFRYDITFYNTNLNFSIERADGVWKTGKIIDAGKQTCLDFKPRANPIATSVAYIQGHGYYGVFDDGAHTVKFIANSYYDGSVNIEYVFE